jgi:hypothetical protein
MCNLSGFFILQRKALEEKTRTFIAQNHQLDVKIIKKLYNNSNYPKIAVFLYNSRGLKIINMKKISKLIILLLVFNIGASLSDLKAQRPMHEIHSMLIFNFIKYIDWPDAAKSGDFIIAVYGDDDVYDQLNTFYSNRPIKGQTVQIINVSSLSDFSSAHVVYVADKKSSDFESLSSKFNGKPTLIITDRSGLGKKGSCINFKEVGGKLKFEINQASFDSNKLKISSQLVSMGIVI